MRQTPLPAGLYCLLFSPSPSLPVFSTTGSRKRGEKLGDFGIPAPLLTKTARWSDAASGFQQTQAPRVMFAVLPRRKTCRKSPCHDTLNCRQLAKTPYTRRAQAITWKTWEDNSCYDPACLQSVWCRIIEEGGRSWLSMNVRFRSNDAYKAAFMNMFALVRLQQKIAARVAELSGIPIALGRYCHMADSYHIYGSNLAEFEGRFLGALSKRLFEQRTMRYEDVREVMEAARPSILEKARKMGRSAGQIA